MGKLDTFEQWVRDGTAQQNLALMQSAAMQGKSLQEIAEEFNMSEKSLKKLQQKHNSVKTALSNGRDTVVAMCQNKLMDQVRSGDTTAIIYSLKIYGGDFFNDRRFVNRTEISGKDGGEIKVGSNVMFYLPEKRSIEDGEQ